MLQIYKDLATTELFQRTKSNLIYFNLLYKKAKYGQVIEDAKVHIARMHADQQWKLSRSISLQIYAACYQQVSARICGPLPFAGHCLINASTGRMLGWRLPEFQPIVRVRQVSTQRKPDEFRQPRVFGVSGRTGARTKFPINGRRVLEGSMARTTFSIIESSIEGRSAVRTRI